MFGGRPPVARPSAQAIAAFTAPSWRRLPGAILAPLPASTPTPYPAGVASAPLLAVDAPSMLFRAYYALPDSIVGPDGRPVNALLGAANLILREVEKHQPRAVVLCFGPDAAHYRTELYPSYHEKREEEMPAALPHQFALCREFFEGFGWTVATSENLEADDLLGSYAKLEQEAGGRALLLTGDRDMYQ